MSRQHPFFAFRDNFNSMFDDFHRDFFDDDLFSSSLLMNDDNRSNQRRLADSSSSNQHQRKGQQSGDQSNDDRLQSYNNPGNWLTSFPQFGSNFNPNRMKLDVIENPTEYIVNADVPGVGKNDLKVNVENGVLHLSGERKSDHRDEKKDESGNVKYIKRECSYGSFSRSIPLPSDVDDKQIKAKFDSGVLKLTLPRTAEKKQTGQIAIQ